MLDFLHSDKFLKVAAAVCGLAALGANSLPPNTVAFKVCVAVLSACTALGIHAATGREPKAPADAPHSEDA